MGQATFKQLIEMCDSVGPTDGIKALENIVRANENAQAYLFGGDYNDIKKAQKMARTIINQNIAIARLKEYYNDKNV